MGPVVATEPPAAMSGLFDFGALEAELDASVDAIFDDVPVEPDAGAGSSAQEVLSFKKKVVVLPPPPLQFLEVSLGLFFHSYGKYFFSGICVCVYIL